jgi:hypothetical protein
MSYFEAIITRFLQPSALASVPEFFAALVGSLLLWLILLWLLALVLYQFFRRSQERYGAPVAMRLCSARALVSVAALIALDVVILLSMGRVPDWTSLGPHLTLIILCCLFALPLVIQMREVLKTSQTVIRKSRQAGSS